MLGTKFTALVGTGSQVSTITESFYKRHLQPRGRELYNQDLHLHLHLAAANELEIPYSGYLLADVTIAGQVVKDRAFLIIRDPPGESRQPCLLGKNVLGEMADWMGTDEGRQQMETESPPNKGRDADSERIGRFVWLAENTSLPPYSMMVVTATGCGPSYLEEFMVEPLECALPGETVMMPSVVSARSGSFTISLVNAGEETVLLRRRTVVGVICEAEVLPPTISSQSTSCGIEVSAAQSAPVKGWTPSTSRWEEMLPDDLPPAQRSRLLQLLKRNSDVSHGLTWTWDI